jgi:hypothetical protein
MVYFYTMNFAVEKRRGMKIVQMGSGIPCGRKSSGSIFGFVALLYGTR